VFFAKYYWDGSSHFEFEKKKELCSVGSDRCARKTVWNCDWYSVLPSCYTALWVSHSFIIVCGCYLFWCTAIPILMV